MKKLYFTALVALSAAVITGCCSDTPPTAFPKHTTAVLVGTTWKCDKKELRKKGASMDLESIAENIRFCYAHTAMTVTEYNKNGDPYYKEYIFDGDAQKHLKTIILEDANATRNNVKLMIKAALQDELAIIYFTCKATQVPTEDPSETDGLDEAIRLYDGLLLDNEIWELLQEARGRVFLVFETNHGSSMFKASSDPSAANSSENMLFDLVEDIKYRPANTNQLNMVCWSASTEGEELPERSYGSRFTNAFYFKMDWYNLSYQETYDKIFKSISEKQKMTKTVVGEDFSHLSIFR